MRSMRCIKYVFILCLLCMPLNVFGALNAYLGVTGLIKNDPGAYQGYTLFSPLMGKQTYLIDMQGRVVHKWAIETQFALHAILMENGNLLRAVTPNGLKKPEGEPLFEDYGRDRIEDYHVALKQYRSTLEYQAYLSKGGRFDHGGAGGVIQEVDWEGNVVWEFTYSNGEHRQHHDFTPMPNGNILFIAWEYKTAAECLEAGRKAYLCGTDEDHRHPFLEEGVHVDTIVEVNRKGEVVWKWSFWDHLTSGMMSWFSPGKLDVNWHTKGFKGLPAKGYYDPDWNHINSIDYNAELDQIVIASREMGEFYVIDHSTVDYVNPEAGIKKAAGSAGDFVYRWGNPSVRFGDSILFKRIAPTYESNRLQQLFGAHDVQWIDPGLPGEGHFLIFDNGWARPFANFSRVLQVNPYDEEGAYVPQLNLEREDKGHGWEPVHGIISNQVVWKYNAQSFGLGLNSLHLSSAQRLPNGNTLITAGSQGYLLEVGFEGDNSLINTMKPKSQQKPTVQVYWEFVNPVTLEGRVDVLTDGNPITGLNPVFSARRYAADFAGLKGKVLQPLEEGFQ